MLLKFTPRILILFICIIITNSRVIHIPNPLKNTPMPKLFTNYHHFETAIEYIDNNYNNKSIEEKIDKMKNLIERVPEILNNLLLSYYQISFDYNETLLEKLDKDLKNYEIEEKRIKADFLVVIKFEEKLKDDKNISSSFAIKNGRKSNSYERERYAIGYLKINYNYNISSEEKEEKFVFLVLREILRALGFRYHYISHNLIRNYFNNVPLYLIKNSKIYQSHMKYSSLSGFNIVNLTNENSDRFYTEYWNFAQYGFHDIMNNYNECDLTITEFTLNVLKELSQITLPKCDLFEFEQGVEKGFHCLRIKQDCISKKKEKEYFLEFGVYDGTKIKCYLNDKNNIKNKQCGIKYGNLEYDNFKEYFTPVFKQIKYYPLIGYQPIQELNFYKNQTLKLLKNPPSCKPGTPRTIFFQVPPNIFEPWINYTNITKLIDELKEINKDVQYDNITFGENERKYFVTYQTPEDYYLRSCVTKVLNYTGLIRSFSNLYPHNLLLKVVDFKTSKEIGIIPELQKMYTYANFEIVSNKYLEYGFYNTYRYSFPNDFDYMPETYAYPEQKDLILKKFENYTLEEGNLWLIKPKTLSLGIGIHIFHNLSDVPDEYIITKYIEKPHLINNLKYDFRIYVIITGLSPLKIYVYKEGIIRFATEEYSLDFNKIDEAFIFLTNVAHNIKNKEKYKISMDPDTDEGSKWSLQVYHNYCKKNGIDFNKIWDQIKDISIKSILTSKDYFLDKIKRIGTKDKNYFKLLGFDFLLDQNFKLHLLEINSRPSLLMNEINDLKLKPQLVADILNIVGISPFSHDYRDNFKAYDDDLENEQIGENQEGVEGALCEFGRPRGKFELIFPVKEKTNYYKQFYKANIEADEILWEILEK